MTVRAADIVAILDADDRRLAATVAGDTDTLGEILSPGFTYLHNTGFREGRGPYLARFREGGAQVVALDRLGADFRAVGDVVLIDGLSSMTYRMPPTAPEATFRALYLAVWQNIDGAWRLHAYASTATP